MSTVIGLSLSCHARRTMYLTGCLRLFYSGRLPCETQRYLTSAFVERLPRGLRYLNVQELGAIRGADVALLPRTLLELATTDSDGGWSVAERSQMPPALRCLRLSFCGANDGYLAALPASLECLDLRYCPAFTNDTIALLPRGLRVLTLCFPTISGGFACLPPALEELRIVFFRTNLINADDEIARLPAGLQHLSLVDSGNLTDACVPLLPRGLRSLMLVGDDVEFMDACVPFLPRNLNRVELGAGVPNASIKAAYQKILASQ